MSSHDLAPVLRYSLFVTRILWLCVRYHASPSLITHANPSLPFGGLPFGPKHQIFAQFSSVLPYVFLPHSEPVEHRMRIASKFAEEH